MLYQALPALKVRSPESYEKIIDTDEEKIASGGWAMEYDTSEKGNKLTQENSRGGIFPIPRIIRKANPDSPKFIRIYYRSGGDEW